MNKFMTFTMLALTLTLVGCTKKSTDEIVIGHYGSMSGNDATFGKSTDDGVRLAVDEINAAGGIKGKKIKLVTMDTQSNDSTAAAVVTRLIEQEKVLALVGEVASSRSRAAAPIAQSKKVPMVSPSSTNPAVTEVGDYIFRTCFIDPFQGTVMAKFTVENLKLKKVAILREVNSDYSVGLADFYAQKLKELGGEVVADQSYQTNDVDFKAQLTQIKSKKPDAIFIPGYYKQVGLIAMQARSMGITAPLLGGDGWDSPKLSEIGGKAVDGSYFSNHYSNETTDPQAVDFLNRFKTKFGSLPDGLSAAGYDAMKVLAAAIEKSPDLNPTAVRDTLASIKDHKGVTGVITINEKRNATKSAVVVQVQGTTNKYVTTINP